MSSRYNFNKVIKVLSARVTHGFQKCKESRIVVALHDVVLGWQMMLRHAGKEIQQDRACICGFPVSHRVVLSSNGRKHSTVGEFPAELRAGSFELHTVALALTNAFCRCRRDKGLRAAL